MKALQKWLVKNGMGTQWEDLDAEKAQQPTRAQNFQPWEGDLPNEDDDYEVDERLQR